MNNEQNVLKMKVKIKINSNDYMYENRKTNVHILFHRSFRD